jgi:nucleotide-binding universal stress UspA family protein
MRSLRSLAGVSRQLCSCTAHVPVHTTPCARHARRHIHNLLGLGSVSYYTMLRAPCPVVIVKSEGERRN